jgi:hypothetical protein
MAVMSPFGMVATVVPAIMVPVVLVSMSVSMPVSAVSPHRASQKECCDDHRAFE